MYKSVNETSQDILDYLTNHPLAGDTLDGIADWWIERQRIEVAVREVNHALSLLVQEGAVRIIRNKFGENIYKIKG